jgi:hypothetical protein
VSRVHRSQSSRASPANEPQQEGFGLIVARVAERHDVSTQLLPGALEKLVSRPPGGILERPALSPCPRAHVLAIGSEGHAQGAGNRG